jgi:hypothetical protein
MCHSDDIADLEIELGLCVAAKVISSRRNDKSIFWLTTLSLVIVQRFDCKISRNEYSLLVK